MSAVPQLPMVWAPGSPNFAKPQDEKGWESRRSANVAEEWPEEEPGEAPPISLAFYRKHTESTLRRYLYASMQVGRAPSILGDPVGRGWVSSRKVRTFEDALIFVLDVEKCLEKIDLRQRIILSRIILQDYTQAEVAVMLQVAPRTVGYRLCQALDCLTEKLLQSDLLVIAE